jgi:hypothetical protein
VGRAIIILACWLAASGCYLAERDPYRIAVRGGPEGAVEIFYETCERDVQIHSVTLAHRRDTPLWRVTDPSETSRARRFVVGVVPDGFVEEVRYQEPSFAGHYLVIVDSSYLRGETMTFEADQLRTRQLSWG